MGGGRRAVGLDQPGGEALELADELGGVVGPGGDQLVEVVGGAIYSSLLFLRKQIMPNRVLGNVLIAIGGLLPAFGGSLIKLAETAPAISAAGSVLKYLGIFLGVVLLFIGFQLATSSAPAPRPIPQT